MVGGYDQRPVAGLAKWFLDGMGGSLAQIPAGSILKS